MEYKIAAMCLFLCLVIALICWAVEIVGANPFLVKRVSKFFFGRKLKHPKCPQCKSKTGIKEPRGLSVYCEDCGWPEDDRPDH